MRSQTNQQQRNKEKFHSLKTPIIISPRFGVRRLLVQITLSFETFWYEMKQENINRINSNIKDADNELNESISGFSSLYNGQIFYEKLQKSATILKLFQMLLFLLASKKQ